MNTLIPIDPEVFLSPHDLELMQDEEIDTYVERLVDAQEGDDFALEDMEIAARSDRRVST